MGTVFVFARRLGAVHQFEHDDLDSAIIFSQRATKDFSFRPLRIEDTDGAEILNYYELREAIERYDGTSSSAASQAHDLN